MYWLDPRLVRYSTFICRKCGMDGNSSMACFPLCNNIHQHEDSIVALVCSPDLVPQIGCFVDRMDRIPVYWLGHMLVKLCTCIHKIDEMGCNASIACGSSQNNIYHPEDIVIILQFLPNMVKQSVWVVWGFDRQDLSVLIGSQSCQILYMHP